MPNLTDLTGLASSASAIITALAMIPAVAQLPNKHLSATLSAAFVLVLLPFGELPLAGYLRGVTGDLSITTMVLLWHVLLKTSKLFVIDVQQRNELMMTVAGVALIFYPFALGISLEDPYRTGYGNPLLIVTLLVVALVATFRKSTLIALCTTLAVLAWSIGWYESTNLWDYLIDPFISIYAIWIFIAAKLKSRFSVSKQ